MKPNAISAVALATALLLAGCLGSQPTVPAEKFYRLSPPPATAGQPLPAGTMLLALDSVDARGVLVERSLLYRSPVDGAPLQQYPYASWAEPPDVMLQDLLLAGLRSAFGATRVLAPGQRGVPAIRVAMRLRALEQIRDGNQAHARFAASYTAVDANGAILFVLDWDQQAAAGGPSPLEFVNALNGLVNNADREVVERLREVTATTAAAAK